MTYFFAKLANPGEPELSILTALLLTHQNRVLIAAAKLATKDVEDVDRAREQASGARDQEQGDQQKRGLGRMYRSCLIEDLSARKRTLHL